MNRNLDEYIKQPYTRILIPNDDGTYSAEILEFSGCFADGETADEAMKNLSEAAKSWLEACFERGLEIPEPFMNQDFGGKIALRLPRSLHRQAVRFAARDGVSLNQFLVSAVAAKVGAEDAFARLLDKFVQRIPVTAQTNITIRVVNYTPISRTVTEPRIIDLPINYPVSQNKISTEVR